MAGHDFPEQPVRLADGPCREEEGGVRSGRRAVTERDGPEAVDRERLAAGAVKLATLLRLAVTLGLLEVERVDVAIAKVSDEQLAAQLPKVGRANGQPPWRIEPPSRGPARDHTPARVERAAGPVPDP